MIYWLLGIVLLAGLILLLRVRVRFDFDDTRRLLFVGLGRTGPEFDFQNQTVALRLAGVRLRSRPMDRTQKQIEPDRNEPKKTRRLSFEKVISLAEQSASPLWQFGSGVIKKVAVEEGWAEIRAGFESPDLTGMSLGYYYTLVGAVPALQAINFIPDWLGPSFAARGRISLTLPLYVLVWRLLVLLVRLPKREIVRTFR